MILLNHSLGGMLRGEGLVRVGLAAHMISTFANILLDPLFILVLKLGVTGAAIATVLGNVIAVAYVILYRARHRDRCVIELRPTYANDLAMLGSVLALGLPNAISSTLSGLAGTFSNQLLVTYGTDAVAAMAAAGKAVMLVTMVQMGICMGVQPLLAYCYGGKDWEKLRGIVRRVLFLTLALGVLLSLGIWFAREWAIGLFIKDPAAAPWVSGRWAIC
jgi:multidrug efflux pump